MTARYLTSLALTLCITGTLLADTVIVNENFESYATDADLYAVWASSNTSDDGILDDGTINPNAYPGDGLGGTKGVDHLGGSVNQYTMPLGTSGAAGNAVVPTESQSLVLSGDIFDTEAAGNKRMSIGLRYSDVIGTENIIELGFWNSFSLTDGTVVDNPSYGARMVLFPGGATGYTGGWVPIELDPSLDVIPDEELEGDGIVGPGDIGEAWHRYSAIITPSDITITMDLYRDGINNATESAGVDYSQTFDIVTTANGYNNLRIGGPSGVTSAGGGVVFDNISLTLVDVETGGGLTGDYNGDGLVDAADYTVWRDTFNQNVTPGEGADGNGDGTINTGDYNVWVSNYGSDGSTITAATAAPEPTALGLIAGVLATVLTGARRSRVA
ncbi:hypothetical protein Pla123a_12300 [Posidoniimonas polymericola]|uniref:PEP-CTERM protein-sorting domain-containing protein n=1 Tax=Posidoniimonas polymericola TaxID=2528002 RepID=A0A5C5YTZ8_9BACT|nr:dockerin type I domain-containing protein [Posidoniimonas polymericola]TWT78438.1 hypothetical protein Pla123a_12300 [Posidoniimonas polymericola]